MNKDLIKDYINKIKKSQPQEEPLPVKQRDDTAGQYAIVFERDEPLTQNNNESAK